MKIENQWYMQFVDKDAKLPWARKRQEIRAWKCSTYFFTSRPPLTKMTIQYSSNSLAIPRQRSCHMMISYYCRANPQGWEGEVRKSPRNECFISEELRSGELRRGDRKMAVRKIDRDRKSSYSLYFQSAGREQKTTYKIARSEKITQRCTLSKWNLVTW